MLYILCLLFVLDMDDDDGEFQPDPEMDDDYEEYRNDRSVSISSKIKPTRYSCRSIKSMPVIDVDRTLTLALLVMSVCSDRERDSLPQE